MHYQRLRELRENHGMTQQGLAQLLHCAQQTYSDYERGKSQLSPDILLQLADLYQTTVDDLLGRCPQK